MRFPVRNSIKTLVIVYLACFLPLVPDEARAQSPITAPYIQTQELDIISPALPPVSSISATVVGNPGSGTFFYWVVANYPSGHASPFGPAQVTNVPNALSGSAYVTVSWNPAPNATSYDVLRTTSPVLPNGAASIAVATAQTGTSINDQGSALTSYTINTLPGGQVLTKLNAANGGTVTGGPVNIVSLAPYASADAALAACFASLPATGGVCDAQGLTGTQTISADPFTGVTKRGKLLLSPGTTWNQSVMIHVPTGWTVDCGVGGISPDGSVTGCQFVWQGSSSGTMWQIFNAFGVSIRGVILNCNQAGNSTTTGLLIDSDSTVPTTHDTYTDSGIINCHTGVQWGGANGHTTQQMDSQRFEDFGIRGNGSDLTAVGFVVNSSNAGQYSLLRRVMIQLLNVGVNILATGPYHSFRNVVTGTMVGTNPTAIIFNSSNPISEISVQDSAVDGSASGATRCDTPDGAMFLYVPPTAVASSVTLTFQGNQLGAPICISGPRMIVSIGNYTTNPSYGQQVSQAWASTSAVVSINDGFSWCTNACLGSPTGLVTQLAQPVNAPLGANSPPTATFAAAAGGAASSGTGNGGSAAPFTYAGGTGGIGGATSGTGGSGSDFSITTGTGGAATVGSTTGRGGNLNVTLGSAGGTGTAGAAGSFNLAGGTVAGTNTTPFLNLTGTWNTSGIITGAIFANITGTAFGAGSKLIHMQTSGVDEFTVDAGGSAAFTGNVITPVFLASGATGLRELITNSPMTIQAGADAATTGAGGILTLRGENVTGTPTDLPGGDAILAGGRGTGASVVTHVKIQSPALGLASGTTAQPQITRWVSHTKAGSTTSATATNMLNIASATNTGWGMELLVHVDLISSTPNVCSTTERFSLSGTNNNGAFGTVNIVAGTISTLCSTGTLTLAVSATAANPSVISVTPTWATIASITSATITVQVDNVSQQEITLL